MGESRLTRRRLLGRVGRQKAAPSPQRAREIRERAHVSLAEMGDVLGVHRSAIHQWEVGNRRPHGELGDAYYRLLAQLEALDQDPEEVGS